MHRKTVFALLAWVFSVPFLTAEEMLVKLPSSPGGAGAFCNRVGEVRVQDVFAQTFLLKQDDGQMETVPFSRWTEFFKVSSDSSRNIREIEPTGIRLGDRLCVLLDPSEATARLILVLQRVRVLVKTAAEDHRSLGDLGLWNVGRSTTNRTSTFSYYSFLSRPYRFFPSLTRSQVRRTVRRRFCRPSRVFARL